MKTHPIALITGSARRIGARIAQYLDQHDIDVIIHCNRSQQQGKDLVAEMNKQRPQSVWLIAQDLMEDNAVESIMSQIQSLFFLCVRGI